MKAKKIILGIFLVIVIFVLIFLGWLFLVPRGGYNPGQPEEKARAGNPGPDEDPDMYSGSEWEYYYNKNGSWCSVTGWQWDGDESNMTINVPDEIDGRKVTSLSSNSWTIGPFEAQMPADIDISGNGAMTTEDEECVDPDDDYVTYHFTVIIGPDVTETSIHDTWVGTYNEKKDELDVVYKLEYEVIQREN